MNNDIYEENLRVLNRIKEYCQKRESCDTELEDEDCPFLEWCSDYEAYPSNFVNYEFEKMAEVLE